MKITSNCSMMNIGKSLQMLLQMGRSLTFYLTQFFRQLLTALQVVFYSLIFSNLTFIPYVHAGPTDGSIVAGTGSISQNGLSTIINQTSNSMVIDWN